MTMAIVDLFIHKSFPSPSRFFVFCFFLRPLFHQGLVDLFLSDTPMVEVCRRAANAGARHVLLKVTSHDMTCDAYVSPNRMEAMDVGYGRRTRA